MLTRIIAFFLSFTTLFSALWGLCFGGMNENIQKESNIMPDTWAAVDGLGRTLPLAGEVKEKDKTKFVGMFYWIWHTNFAQRYEALNATEILSEHPEILYDFESPLWPEHEDGRPYYWNKPLYGYYRDTDEYVLRKHAELIADAGVDVIIFDCTNGTYTWDESYEKLFEVFEKARVDGVNVPKVAFMLPFNDGSDTTVSLKNLYERIYSKGRYEDLWFYWDGKPLIMAHSSGLDLTDKTERDIYRFFTFRQNEPTYFCKDKSYMNKTWGWCSDYPQTKFGKSLSGKVEQMCVSVAQNAANGALVAMNAEDEVQGRSFVKGNYSYSFKKGNETVTADKNTENSLLYGLNFQQQWDNAIACDPDFVFVTGWNEWIAGRWKEWQGTRNAFPDQFSDEYSRDIEPADGILKDHYYYQLVANIRRFKGISDKTIEENGEKTYYHYTGSTVKRISDAWQGLSYTSDTMRNDFVKAQVKNDKENITFKIYTKENISPKGNAWMRIFIDTDQSGVSPGWEGFEYIINRENAGEKTLTVEKSTGGWNFEKTGEAQYTVIGNEMTVTVPVSALGLSENVHFNFKLSDNMQTDGDVMDFYKNGDVAPGGRFMFVY
ncbi:MAG: hypothetical protein K6B52_06775 [Clostridiales bacterium]|nr:hypothetical protein [Clostridiales bacterium]